MEAIDAELAERAGNQEVNGSAAVLTGTEPMGCDPLTALSNEYGAEWEVSNPGRYVADHRRLDVTLVSDSVSGLAEKLRAFTELIEDLVNPGIHRRAEILPAQLVIHEDLSPRVVVGLDLEVRRLFGGGERALALPAVSPVAYGVRLARVLALDDH
jgi:hypothetical protein